MSVDLNIPFLDESKGDIKNKVHFTIFEPDKLRSMKSEYPELAKFEEFSLLSNVEMKFVWYYANKTSAYEDLNSFSGDTEEKRKSKKAYTCLFASGLSDRMSPELLHSYLQSEFPPKIVDALRVMSNFIPNLRYRANTIAEKALMNLEIMADIKVEELKDMSMEEKNKYATFIKTTSSLIPSLIKDMEDSYGTKIKELKDKTNEKVRTSTFMDQILSQEN